MKSSFDDDISAMIFLPKGFKQSNDDGKYGRNARGTMLKNRPNLFAFNERISTSLYIYIYIYGSKYGSESDNMKKVNNMNRIIQIR